MWTVNCAASLAALEVAASEGSGVWYTLHVRVAVIGHVEWVEFARIARLPAAGEIIHAEPLLEVPAGGGGVAAVQLARWGVGGPFFTALGDDPLGRRAHVELGARGVDLRAAFRERQRRALTLVDAHGERTIVVLGDRLVPHGADALPWDELATCDAVYVTGGDVAAVRQARRARVMVATARIAPLLRAAGVELDALVGSASDPDERYAAGDLPVAPHLVVRTEGARGGTFVTRDGTSHRYEAVPAPVRGDTYGAGDTFAAALTCALGGGERPVDAMAFAAARAAEVVAYQGPYPPTSFTA
jgi:ribokinase